MALVFFPLLYLEYSIFSPFYGLFLWYYFCGLLYAADKALNIFLSRNEYKYKDDIVYRSNNSLKNVTGLFPAHESRIRKQDWDILNLAID